MLVKFGGHRSYGNKDINCYINSYINTFQKAKLNASLHHIERFSKSEIPIYNPKVLDRSGRKKVDKIEEEDEEEDKFRR